MPAARKEWFRHGWLHTHCEDEPLPVRREEVFAAWLDPAKFTRATGKPAKGGTNVGDVRTSFGGWATSTLEEIDPPRRIVERWRSKRFPKDWPDSFIVVDFEEPKPGTTVVRLRQGSAKEGGGIGYDTMIFWISKGFAAFCDAFERKKRATASPADRAAADRAKRPPAASIEDVRKQLGAARAPEAWVRDLEKLALPAARKAYWKSKLPVQRGLEAWVRAVAIAAPVLGVRAALAAAEVALPVWTAAAKSKPEGFADVAGMLGPSTGAPPAKVLAAVRTWLGGPSPKRRDKAFETLDASAQLRFTDKDLGDQSGSTYTLALEAARSAVHAIDDTKGTEAALATVAALDAIRGRDKALAPEKVAAVAEAIRKAVLAGLE